MLVHLNYSLKWEIFIKLFHIFKLRHSLIARSEATWQSHH